MTYLVHITLDTADARRSFRDEVSDHVSAALAPIVADVLSAPGRRAALPPPLAGYSLSITADGRSAMIATVWRGVAPALTFGVARDERAGERLWRILHQDAAGVPKTDPARQPAAPWLAVRMEIGAGLLAQEPQGPADLMALADFERCVAWAFLDAP